MKMDIDVRVAPELSSETFQYSVSWLFVNNSIAIT